MNFHELNLKPGDRLIVPKSELKLVQHHVIYLGKDYQGQDLIAENKIDCGVRIISAKEFFKDVITITQIIQFEGGNYERKIAVQKALSKAGVGYDLINYNCEHFANEIQYGKKESKQVRNVFAGLVVLLIIALFVTD
jgi:hypothetical protein